MSAASLSDLIKEVRACQTMRQERAVLSRESALIRTAIKNERKTDRRRNMSKLLYIHMRGLPAHFGQLECMKMIGSENFATKRMGYLAMVRFARLSFPSASASNRSTDCAARRCCCWTSGRRCCCW